MDSRKIVNEITSDACMSLFSDYSLSLQASADDAGCGDQLAFCAVIGFSSQQMRGTLILATSSEPIGRTTPVQGAPLREWIAELSNQLLGRIKRQLAQRGVILAISTPVVLRGEHLRPLSSSDAEPLVFGCDGGCVAVWIDLELASELDLTQLQDCQVMGEGEALLF